MMMILKHPQALMLLPYLSVFLFLLMSWHYYNLLRQLMSSIRNSSSGMPVRLL